jgi:hypothetical protein
VKRIIFIALILILSCKENTRTDKTDSGKNTESEFKLEKSDYTILPYRTEWYWIFKNAEPYELTNNDLTEIEKILVLAVAENNQIQREALIERNKDFPDDKRDKTGYELELDSYYRQYVPVINEKGEKEVWINFFCDDFGAENWKSEIMIVEDGGNCYFEIKINLNKKEYYDLGINGYA